MARHLNPSLTSRFDAAGFEAGHAHAPGLWQKLRRFYGSGSHMSVRHSATAYGTALDALNREIDRIRLQSRHWLM